MRPIANNVSGVYSMPAASRWGGHREFKANVRTLRLAHMRWLCAEPKWCEAFGVRHHGRPSLTLLHQTLFHAASHVPMPHSIAVSAAEGTRSREIRETHAIGIALRNTLRQSAVVQRSRRGRQIHTEMFQLQRSMVRRGNYESVGHCAGQWARDPADRSTTCGHLQFGLASRALVCAESDEIVFGRRPCAVLVAESHSQRWTSEHLLFGHSVGHRSTSESFAANENVSLWLRALQWCDRARHQLQCIPLHAGRMYWAHVAWVVGRMEFELDVSNFE